MRLIVTGATGRAGGDVVRQALTDPDVISVTALVRRPVALLHPKLTVIELSDFLDYGPVLSRLGGHDACLWCLGVSQRDVNEADYIRITRDFAVTGASALLSLNPDLTFGFLSGEGAASNERSRLLFGRIKGQTENRLNALGFRRLYHFRPAYIEPSEPGSRKRLDERLIITPLAPLLHRLLPQSLITSRDLAIAMLDVVKHGADDTILGNMALRRRAAIARARVAPP